MVKSKVFKKGIKLKSIKIPKGFGVSSISRGRSFIDVVFIKRKFPKKKGR